MNNLSVKEKVEIAHHKVISMASLYKAGIVFHKEEYLEPTELLDESFKFWLSGREGIELSIIFDPMPNGKDSITVFIYKRKSASRLLLNSWQKKQSLYNNNFTEFFYKPKVDDDFCLDDWLKWRGEKNIIESFRLSSYSGSFENKLDEFFMYLESIFSLPEMFAILSGKTWEDVPFDWGDMK